MMALHLSGVVSRRRWKPPRLKPWEGPFADPTCRAAAGAGRGGAANGRHGGGGGRVRGTPAKTGNHAPEPPHAGAQTAAREAAG